MDSYGIKFIRHGIPHVLPVNFSAIFAFRIQNASIWDVHFQSYSSFYGTAINHTALRLSVFLDEDFLTNVLVYNDCIHAGERVTLFFPFRSGNEGEYRLQVALATYHMGAVSHERCPLFETALCVKGNISGIGLAQKVRHCIFTFLHAEWPIQLKRWQLRFHRAKRAYLLYKNASQEKTLKQLKEINRELAFMEKQVRKLKPASLPCYLGMDTTSKCNLKCIFCFRNYLDTDFNARADMAEDTLDQLIQELFPTALTLNLSTVGEPLLSSHIEKILKASSDYQVSLSLTTNGTLLKRDDFLKKLASVLQHIEISFDSASPELFERLRLGASYEKILEHATRLGQIRRTMRDPKFNLGFSMTLFRDNLMEVPEVLRMVSEAGGNFLKTDIGVIFSKKHLDQSVINDPDLYNAVYEAAHKKAQQLGINLLMRPPFSENGRQEAVKVGICDYLYLSACIRSEGELNPCYFPVLSSLNVKNGFRNAWKGESMQRLRRDHDTERCHPLCRDCYLVAEGRNSVEQRRKQFLKGDALKWGVFIDFGEEGNADQYKSVGWGKAEGPFTWTDGLEASISIPIDASTSPFISLKARLAPFLCPGDVDTQTVRILINGKSSGIWIFTKAELQEKELFIQRTSIMGARYLKIAFLMANAVSPFALGLSEDKRMLGLAVQSIQLPEW